MSCEPHAIPTHRDSVPLHHHVRLLDMLRARIQGQSIMVLNEMLTRSCSMRCFLVVLQGDLLSSADGYVSATEHF